MSMSYENPTQIGYKCPECDGWYLGLPVQAWGYPAEHRIMDGGITVGPPNEVGWVIRDDAGVLYGDELWLCHDTPACIHVDTTVDSFPPVVVGGLQCTLCSLVVLYDDEDITRAAIEAHEFASDGDFDSAWEMSRSSTPHGAKESALDVIKTHWRRDHRAEWFLREMGANSELDAKITKTKI